MSEKRPFQCTGTAASTGDRCRNQTTNGMCGRCTGVPHGSTGANPAFGQDLTRDPYAQDEWEQLKAQYQASGDYSPVPDHPEFGVATTRAAAGERTLHWRRLPTDAEVMAGAVAPGFIGDRHVSGPVPVCECGNPDCEVVNAPTWADVTGLYNQAAGTGPDSAEFMAAVAAESQWRDALAAGRIEDAGTLGDQDVGGDVQAGPSAGRRFLSGHPSGDFVVTDVLVYASNPDPDNPTEPYSVDTQICSIRCTDPADPGGTEINSDYSYDTSEPLYSTLDEANAAAAEASRNITVRDVERSPAFRDIQHR